MMLTFYSKNIKIELDLHGISFSWRSDIFYVRLDYTLILPLDDCQELHQHQHLDLHPLQQVLLMVRRESNLQPTIGLLV